MVQGRTIHSSMSFVPYPYKKRSGFSFFARRIVTGALHPDPLEEFLMPTKFWKKEGPNDVLYSRKMEPLHLSTLEFGRDSLDRKFSPKHGLTEEVPSLSRLVPLTLLQDSSFSGYINDTVYVPPLPNTFPEVAGRLRPAVVTVTPTTFTNV